MRKVNNDNVRRVDSRLIKFMPLNDSFVAITFCSGHKKTSYESWCNRFIPGLVEGLSLPPSEWLQGD